MATVEKNGVITLTKRQAILIAQACDVAMAQLRRAIAKESDEVIKERREAQVRELQECVNAVLYGGKEL